MHLLHRSPGGLGGFGDAVLALLDLDLGGTAGPHHRDTAGQLGQPLLQLLAVLIGSVVLVLLASNLAKPKKILSPDQIDEIDISRPLAKLASLRASKPK